MSELDQLNHEHTGKGLMCSHVLEQTRPMTEAWHLPDGTWDFLCGHDDHSWELEEEGSEVDVDEIEDIHVVCAECTVKHVRNSNRLSNMERGKVANWDQKLSQWIIREMTAEELAECFEVN